MIEKKLKKITFRFDEDQKEFTIFPFLATYGIALNRTYAFSFVRFFLRCVQKRQVRKRQPQSGSVRKLSEKSQAGEVLAS